MQTYEIFLTSQCTRECKFCDICKDGYKSSDDDVSSFIQYVKEREEKLSNFHISFFGGEPFMQVDAIYKIVDAFKDYPNCYFFATTNGDFLDRVDTQQLSPRFVLSISAYDIFDNVEKYKRLAAKFSCLQPTFLFTFDQSTINRLDDFVSICQMNSLSYKVVFSHSLKSWNSMPIDELEDRLHKFYSNEINQFYSSKEFAPSQSIAKYFNRFAQCILDESTEEFFCTTDSKEVLYRGKNIGSCIRLKDTKDFQYPTRCKTCKYAQCCSKGCIAEYHDSSIDEKLCAISKVAFEVIEDFINSHQTETRLKKILCLI